MALAAVFKLAQAEIIVAEVPTVVIQRTLDFDSRAKVKLMIVAGFIGLIAGVLITTLVNYVWV